ncbi:MAG TPA: winged helix-turn-helix domain-containing protein [Vicinamibacterales bacterium]|jgi:Tol biopolymer transport system component/DNA-binding winged helix-turn-helix (wHTH) protein
MLVAGLAVSRAESWQTVGFQIGDSHHVEPPLNRVTGPRGSVRLEPKVMQVLVYLADHAGQVVTKDRLMAAIWTDTAVTDDVLTRAVSELRRLFDDDAKRPRVIETIPKTGYRMIAPLAGRQRQGAPLHPVSVWARPAWLVSALAAALLIGVGAPVWLLLGTKSAHIPASPPPALVHLTAFEGLERSPTFSPDGSQIAFSWNGENEDNFDIYVKLVGSSEVRRLTDDPAPDVNPAWSPDGRQIAFVREGPAGRGTATIRLISPLGGTDRKLTDLEVLGPIDWSPDSSAIGWSPDGRWVAASLAAVNGTAEGNGGISLIPAFGGASRLLTHATLPTRDVAPAFSSDGRWVAYASCAAGMTAGAPACEVYIAALGRDYAPVAPARRLTAQALAIQGVAWTRDASSIVYDAAGRGPFHLWRVKADGTTLPERLEVAGFGSRKPATSSSRDLLAFERRLATHGVYRLKLNRTPEPVLVSSVFDYHPQFSPDGRRLVFASRRSGDALELWIASADGSNPQQLAHGPGPRQDSPHWSPNGQQIAFASLQDNGHWDVWVMDADGGPPRRLTSDPGDENAPTWSGDGRLIYFSSDRGGARDIWRTSAAGGPIERVTYGGSGMVAYESIDGRSILYQTATSDSPLVALPLKGGPARALVGCVRSQAFAIGATGIYYSPCGNGPDASIHRLDATTRADTVVGHVTAPFLVSDLAVSPDGTILVARHTEAADLMLLEHFR